MRKTWLSYTLASVVACSAWFTSAAQAGATGNIGLASNYIWRGVTQTRDQAAISGGLDYSADIGFYAGTWLANVDYPRDDGEKDGNSGYELDLYGGYAGEIEAFNYNAGLIYFAYPVQDDLNFLEVLLSGGVGPLSVGVNYTVTKEGTSDDNDIYYFGELGFEDVFNGETLANIGLGFVIGRYEYDDDSVQDYTHYGLRINKGTDLGDFTFAVDKNDLDGGNTDDPRVSVSLTKAFDL